jgi:hypothetical protein
MFAQRIEERIRPARAGMGRVARYRLFVASGSMRRIVTTETEVYWRTDDAQTMLGSSS